MAYSTILAISEGASSALMREHARHQENIVRQGLAHSSILAYLTDQISSTIFVALMALQSAGRHVPSFWATFSICVLLSKGISYLVSKEFENQSIRCSLIFAYIHIGSITRLISLISYAILFAYGQTLLATSAFIWTGILLLKHHDYLPKKIDNLVYPLGTFLGAFYTIFEANWLTKILNIMPVAVEVFELAAPSVKPSPLDFEEEPKIRKSNLSNFYKLLRSGSEPSIDPKHLKIEGLPRLPKEINANMLNDIAEKINFDDVGLKEMLAKKLEKDARYQQVKGLVTPREHIISELAELIKQVSTEKIKVGAPSDYRRVKYYLNYITYWITEIFPNLSIEERKKMETVYCIQMHIINLAVGGGTYCGAGELRAIGNVFYDIVLSDPDSSFEKKLPFILQIERQYIYEVIYKTLQSYYPRIFVELFLSNDNHKYNQWTALLEEDLGLQKTGAREEQRSQETTYLHFFANFGWVRLLKLIFFEYYDVDCVVKQVQDTIKNQEATEQFSEWWKQYLENAHIDERLKLRYLHRLHTKNEVVGVPLWQEDGTVANPFLVKLMLVELGYLKL